MIIKLKRVTNKNKQAFANDSFLDARYGFWGNVTAVDSKKMKVRVRAATGFEYIGIPVCSQEWVNKQNGKFSGSRNLPPVGSRVFVFTPTGTITGAFVLCSGYAEGDTETHDLWEENKENEKKIVTVNGWTKIEDVENSHISISSPDEKIKLDLVPDGDSAIVAIKAFKLNVSVTENGISIDGQDNVTMSFQKKVTIDSGTNNIEVKTNSLKVIKNGETVMEVS